MPETEQVPAAEMSLEQILGCEDERFSGRLYRMPEVGGKVQARVLCWARRGQRYLRKYVAQWFWREHPDDWLTVIPSGTAMIACDSCTPSQPLVVTPPLSPGYRRMELRVGLMGERFILDAKRAAWLRDALADFVDDEIDKDLKERIESENERQKDNHT